MRLSAEALGQRLGANRVGFYRNADAEHVRYRPGWTDGIMPALTGTQRNDQFGRRVAVTLHGYRSRWLSEPLDPQYDSVAGRVAASDRLSVPTIMIQGEADACDPPAESANDARWFDGPYECVVLPSVGHFPGREAPARVAEAVIHFRERISAGPPFKRG